MDGGLRHCVAGSIDGRGENANQAAQADRRQVTAPYHRADRLLVATQSAGGVRDRKKQWREA
jgi:hypothetical protein